MIRASLDSLEIAGVQANAFSWWIVRCGRNGHPLIDAIFEVILEYGGTYRFGAKRNILLWPPSLDKWWCKYLHLQYFHSAITWVQNQKLQVYAFSHLVWGWSCFGKIHVTVRLPSVVPRTVHGIMDWHCCAWSGELRLYAQESHYKSEVQSKSGKWPCIE